MTTVSRITSTPTDPRRTYTYDSLEPSSTHVPPPQVHINIRLHLVTVHLTVVPIIVNFQTSTMFVTLVVNLVYIVVLIFLLLPEQCHLYIAVDIGVEVLECVEDSVVAAEHQPVIGVVEEISGLALEFDIGESLAVLGEKVIWYIKKQSSEDKRKKHYGAEKMME